ncbi:MAG: hypothetical protein ACI4F4_07525 [Lachnospiraceae bacterium]
MKMKDMGKGDIYQICKKVRMNGIFAGVVVTVIWALLYFVLVRGSFVDIFYGINRVYLLIFIVGIGFIVVNGFCLLINLDKKQIQNQVAEQGIYLEQFESNLDEGVAFCQKGGSDVFFISSQYGLLRSRGVWKVIRTENIMKLGVDRIERGQVVVERAHCLMRDGNVYTVSIPNALAMQAVEFLKMTMNSGIVTDNN